jgi:hypothetical protein
MTRILCAAICVLGLAVPVWSQTRRAEALAQPAVAAPYQHPVLATRPYQQTWYSALLRQFNPDNLDWGHWLEQRREAFLEQTAANAYFKYSLVTTTMLILLSIALAKTLIDKSRIKWLAAERHEDLLGHDRYSRQVAHEAIRKYNTHMEKCNRVVEAEVAEQRATKGGNAAAETQGRPEEALTQAADLRRQRDVLASQLQQNTAMVGQLAARLNSIGTNVGKSTDGDRSVQSDMTQADLMKQNNELREQLYRERERNKRLKGM